VPLKKLRPSALLKVTFLLLGYKKIVPLKTILLKELRFEACQNTD
jgi:hypothetical protein